MKILLIAVLAFNAGLWTHKLLAPIRYDNLVVYKITDWPNRDRPWIGECYYSGRDAYCAADKRSAKESE